MSVFKCWAKAAAYDMCINVSIQTNKKAAQMPQPLNF